MEEVVQGTALATRWLIGAALIYAGISKIRYKGDFARSLRAMSFLPAPVRSVATVALPPAEVALGAALLLALTPLVFGVVAAAMFAAFGVITVAAYGWQSDADCACFGRLTTTSVKAATARNLALVGLALVSTASALELSAAAGGAVIAVALLSAAALLPSLLGRVSEASAQWQEVAAPNPDRRAFLRLTAAVVGAGSVLALTRGVPTAEAACGPCGSCSTSYIFLQCTGGGCALYWVRPRTQCDLACATCGSWDIQEFCGIPGC